MRRRPAVACSAFLALAACASGTAPAPSRLVAASRDASRGTRGAEVAVVPDGAGSNEARPFFPPGALDVQRDLDAFRAQWYSKHLRAAKEPSLFMGREDAGREAYRFTLLPSFDAPVVVRVEVSRDGSGDLVAVVLTGKGGYEPGEVSKRTTAKLSPSQVAELRAALRHARFWDLAAQKPEVIKLDGTEVIVSGVDGTEWIVEGVAEGRYHVVDRWEGLQGLRDLGLTFLRLAGLPLGPRDF